jgi:hypothetical protein
MGISKTEPINLNNPATLQSFLSGLITQEHGTKGALFGNATIQRGAIQAVIAKAISPDFVRSAINSVPKGQPIPVSAALRGTAPTTQVAAASPLSAGTSTAASDPMSAFMSALTPQRAPSIIDNAFPPAAPIGGPRRGFQVPAFMQQGVAAVGNAVRGAARGVVDAVAPGIGQRADWRSGNLDPIDVATPYERSYGGKTAGDPKQATMDAVKAAVGSVLGPGYSVNAYSGTRPGADKPGHRPDATGKGKALDFYVEGPRGRVTDEKTLHSVIGKLAEMNPTASIGFDKAYMGAGIHFALDNRAEYWGRNSTKHPDKKGATVTPEFVAAVMEGRARGRDKIANPQRYGGIPGMAPRGGLATAAEVAAERQKMIDNYGAYRPGTVPQAPYAPTMPARPDTRIGSMPPARYSPTMPTRQNTPIGALPAAPALMMSRPAIPSIPPASGRPGAVVAGVRPSLPAAGMPAAPARAPAAQSVGRQNYVSPAREFERLVTSAGIPSLPPTKAEIEAYGTVTGGFGKSAVSGLYGSTRVPDQRGWKDMYGPVVEGTKFAVGPTTDKSVRSAQAAALSVPRETRAPSQTSYPNYSVRGDVVGQMAKEYAKIGGIPAPAPAPSSSFIPGGTPAASKLDRAYSQYGYYRSAAPAVSTAPSPPRSGMQTWDNPPAAPSRAAPAPARTADFRQSPAEARAQQMNMMHDKLANPASVAGVRAPTTAPQSSKAPTSDFRAPPAPKGFAEERAAAKAKDPIGIPMQVDRYLASVASWPASVTQKSLGIALERAQNKQQQKSAPAVGPTKGAAQIASAPPAAIPSVAAAPAVVAPPPPAAAPSGGGNPNVSTTRTNDGGIRSVDNQTGWSSYTNPNTGVTTTFTPDGTPVGGGQGMVGGGGGGGAGGK